tara:strand:- start:573 stop:1247 length:675 start_codon:yes stop_codon:yes gene_type:complete
MKVPFGIKEKEEDVKCIRPPNLGWLEKKLSNQEMDYLWRCIKNKKEDFKNKLAGITNISANNKLMDRGDWFWINTIIPLCTKYKNTFKNLGEKVPTRSTHSFYMGDLWVNYQKKHEFVALHTHEAIYSFVIWMKIPTHSEQQRKNPIAYGLDDSKPAHISNFEFEYRNTIGESTNYVYKMDPTMEGMMLFFPSKLNHIVYPFYNCDETRISISGNISLDTSKKL